MKEPVMISASEAIENFDTLINECLDNSEHIILCAPKGSVIMLSYDDYLALKNNNLPTHSEPIPSPTQTSQPSNDMISFDSMDDIQKFISGN